MPQADRKAPDDQAANRGRRQLAPAAARALREADERRKAYREREATLPHEVGGRGGHDPNRYGDWEVKGLASDF